MSKKKHRATPYFSNRKPRQFSVESGFLKDIELYKKRTAELLRFFGDFYWELASQRAKVQDQINLALAKNAIENYKFEGWQRAVKYKYSLDPLNPSGSLKDPGGRFNIGEIDTNRYPTFPALYLATDKDTALQEHLGQIEDHKKRLSALDIALTNPDSVSIVSVKGHLDQVFDLTQSEGLADFVEINGKFEFSENIAHQMKSLRIPEQRVVQNVEDLSRSFLMPNWREMPMAFDIPSNSQIFGQLVVSAGIQGILYPSKLTGKPCLAIFPQTFKNTGSYVELIDEMPVSTVPRRIDANSPMAWEIL